MLRRKIILVLVFSFFIVGSVFISSGQFVSESIAGGGSFCGNTSSKNYYDYNCGNCFYDVCEGNPGSVSTCVCDFDFIVCSTWYCGLKQYDSCWNMVC